MNRVWIIIICLSIVFSLFSGEIRGMGGIMLEACASCITLLLSLAAYCAFFSGLINIMRRIGWLQAVKHLMRHALERLFPDLNGNERAKEAISANFAANLLGVGNAATPAGIQAMKELAAIPRSGRAVSMFLVINCSSIQILPSTVIALRLQADSAAASDIILPALIATIVSTAVGIIALRIMQGFGGERAYELGIDHIGGVHTVASADGDGDGGGSRRGGIRRVC